MRGGAGEGVDHGGTSWQACATQALCRYKSTSAQALVNSTASDDETNHDVQAYAVMYSSKPTSPPGAGLVILERMGPSLAKLLERSTSLRSVL